MSSLLYYPYINLPENDWTIRALLYYDNIGAIVPAQYFYEPEQYTPFMRKAIENELITPINPMNVLDRPWEVSKRFIKYLGERNSIIEQRKRSISSDKAYKIHRDKFLPVNKGIRVHANKCDTEIFDYLVDAGLAEIADTYWYNVENKTARELMFFLTSVIADKIDYLIATDRIDYGFSQIYARNDDIELRTRQYKRDLILKELIPYPKQIDLTGLRQFKDRHHDLLNAFRNKVEMIALNPSITPESPIFTVMVDDMKTAKEELARRMKESHLGEIIFGTICGTISAAIALLGNPVAGAIPGLLSAIYSACKIERPESVVDQTGLKYIALVDKRLRKL